WAPELRAAACDVAPLGETLAPPRVVLGDRMKLWQVEGDQLRIGHGNRPAVGLRGHHVVTHRAEKIPRCEVQVPGWGPTHDGGGSRPQDFVIFILQPTMKMSVGGRRHTSAPASWD